MHRTNARRIVSSRCAALTVPLALALTAAAVPPAAVDALALPQPAPAAPWQRCSDGLPEATVLSLAHVNGTLFAGTDSHGVFRSEDGCATWTPLPANPQLDASPAWSMDAWPVLRTLYVGGRGSGVFRFDIEANAWAEQNDGLNHRIVQDVLVAGTDVLAATYGGGVYVASVWGGPWRPFRFNAGLDDLFVYALAQQHGFLYAGTAGKDDSATTGVAYRTWLDDDHAGWSKIDDGFVLNGAHLDSVFALGADGFGGGSNMFAGTDDVGLYRASTRGDRLGRNPGAVRWERVQSDTGDVHAIYAVGHHVYYGTSFAGTFRSDDDGATFLPNLDGFTNGNATMPNLVKDFASDGRFLYAASDLGVFRQPLPADVVTPTATATSSTPRPSPTRRPTRTPGPTPTHVPGAGQQLWLPLAMANSGR